MIIEVSVNRSKIFLLKLTTHVAQLNSIWAVCSDECSLRQVSRSKKEVLETALSWA